MSISFSAFENTCTQVENAIPILLTVIYSVQVLLKILNNRNYIYNIVSVLAVFQASKKRDLLMERK